MEKEFHVVVFDGTSHWVTPESEFKADLTRDLEFCEKFEDLNDAFDLAEELNKTL